MNKSTQNNNLLVAVNVLSRVDLLLSAGTREQLSRDKLQAISSYMTSALNALNIDSSFDAVMLDLSVVIDTINDLLKDETFMATTDELKSYIVSKCEETITLYIVTVGKYFTTEEFDYTSGMDTVLKLIVNTCIDNNYYFNLEE